MGKQKKQKFEGIVYSTADDFAFEDSLDAEKQETLPNVTQNLKVGLDRKSRKGKVVTIIEGFVGTEEDLESLAKLLKQKCGVGGAAKGGKVLIQGDFKLKLIQMLSDLGYKVKGFGG